MSLRSIFPLIILSTIVGCDGEWAKGFDYGRPIPNFRFLVHLPAPVPRSDLVRRIESFAQQRGFTDYRGRPISNETLSGNSPINILDFFPSGSTAMQPYFVTFILKSEGSDQLSVFELIFKNRSLESFSEKEWMVFKTWRDQYLPSSFPNSVIVTSRHPAVFTEPSDLIRISETTGIPIPSEFLSDSQQ